MSKQKPLSREEMQTFMATMAPIMGIHIQDEWKPVVVSHLETAAHMARILEKVNLEDNPVEDNPAEDNGVKGK